MNEWKLGVSYKKNDIVFKYIYDNFGLIDTEVYYKCNISHISDYLVGPWSDEEMYWTKVIKVIKKRSLKINTKKNKNNIGEKINQENVKIKVEEIKVEETIEEIKVEETVEEKERIELKRKIKNVEDELDNYNKKRKMEGSIKLTIEERILLLDTDISTKSFLIDKYELLKNSRDSDYTKGLAWLKTVVDLPFNNYKNYKIKKTDKKDKINKFFTNIREKLDNVVYGLDETKDEILEFLAKKITNPDSKGHILALCGSKGTGKCFSKNTPILMFDGTVKMVQDIKIGDILMGDDSKPRNVLTLGNGRDTMYKITNVKGENYTVNSEHILCLKYSGKKYIIDDKKNKRFRVKWFNNKEIKINLKDFYYNNKEKDVVLEKSEEFLNNIKENWICEISVKKYLKLSNSMKKHLNGYSVPINFSEKELDFDPYIIGLWLGDGESSSSGITNQDSSIIKYLKDNLQKYNCYLQHNANYQYRINGGKSNGHLGKSNIFLNTLKKYNLVKNKHIPMIYKCNSRENRLRLLAGLIDSDGSLDKNKAGYEFSQSLKHEQIIDDIIYLCRSLGFACYKKTKKTSWTYLGIKKYGEAWRIHISGKGIEEIPVMCPRKKANPRRQIKDVLVSGITIEVLPEDNYYGFMIDENERFVLGNFIVTHNTKILHTLAEALDLPFNQINFGGINDGSILTGHSETYVGSKPGKIVEMLTKSKCMNSIFYLDEIDKIADHKNKEINGILTHLLDEEQNDKFQDNYLSNINIDLSKVFFVISFNDITKVNPIVLDRMRVIKIKNPSMEDKLIIAQDKLIPQIKSQCKNTDLPDLTKDIIHYIVYKVPKEDGVRQLKKTLEKIFNKLNYMILLGKKVVLNTSFIDSVLKIETDDTSYKMMYI